MKTIIVALSLVMTAGCVQLTEQQIEERQYRNLDWQNQFVDYRHRCQSAGGRMVVQASGRLGRAGIPRRGDYYTCTQRIASLRRD